jgi:hypothetical protein
MEFGLDHALELGSTLTAIRVVAGPTGAQQ